VVFHLFGKTSSSPDFVICDEDMLEFVHALQDKQRQPDRLFDELRSKHLLILGCGLVEIVLLAATLMTPNAELWTLDKRLNALADRFGVAYQAGMN
jgi:hypothetical protein